MERREFLGSSVAAAAAVSTVRAQVEGTNDVRPPVVSSFDPWVELHREHLVHNIEQITRRVERRPILAVIKNNAYGLGLATVAQWAASGR